MTGDDTRSEAVSHIPQANRWSSQFQKPNPETKENKSQSIRKKVTWTAIQSPQAKRRYELKESRNRLTTAQLPMSTT
jgi:hypothetical protein